jgi:hypothetical protein
MDQPLALVIESILKGGDSVEEKINKTLALMNGTFTAETVVSALCLAALVRRSAP